MGTLSTSSFSDLRKSFVLSGGDRKVHMVSESLMQRSIISVCGNKLQNVKKKINRDCMGGFVISADFAGIRNLVVHLNEQDEGQIQAQAVPRIHFQPALFFAVNLNTIILTTFRFISKIRN